ncbi:MAG: zf-HC2 domain-containing protein [Candidatus Korobacteraceae bacterium]
MIPSGPHDEFLEFCAVSTSGQLSQEDQARLQAHLAVCGACRDAFREYESIVNEIIPAIAADEASELAPGTSWSQAKAEKAFFGRLAQEEKRESGAAEETGDRDSAPTPSRRVLPFAPESTWRHVWMLYAAGILLFFTLSFCAYWVGIRRGTEVAKVTSSKPVNQLQASLPDRASLQEQLSDAAHEREIARAQIAQQDKALAGLRQQLERQSVEMGRMKETQAQLEGELRNGQSGKQDVVQQRAELEQKLEAAQSESQVLSRKLDTLTHESALQTASAKVLEGKVSDLTRQLQERDTAIDQRDQLLAHDRDIRDLMGARDLYVAEVYDVGDNGATKKPYGRVFYTKGKSLIFYAYDLDQQGIKQASTFQAWGRRGPDRQQALNLGIFYEDNASKKRWVLKIDDPKTLAQIDAVFVTMEPAGHSDKPSGKPLLFAYLRVDPNHP